MTLLTRAMQEGFALAALLANDRELARVRGAISPALASEVVARLTGDKTKLLRELLERVRPPLDLPPERLSPRAASLLSPHMARRTRADGATFRPGYVAPEGLVPVLLRLARASSRDAS
jgi:hypothetical protein